MGMANFGAFMGGLSQGQQQAAQQAERKQYLQMLLARQQKTDQDKTDDQEAQARTDLALLGGSGAGSKNSNLFADPGQLTPATGDSDPNDDGVDGDGGSAASPQGLQIPGAGPMVPGMAPGALPGGAPPMGTPQPPMPGAPPGTAPPQGQPVPPPGGNPNAPPQGAQAPPPGQGSVPANRMMPRPMPPQAGGAPPQQMMPGQRPMPGQPGQQPPQGGPQRPPQGQPPQGQPGQPQRPPGGPQGAPPQGAQSPTGLPQPQSPEQAVQQMQVLQQRLATPMAQKIVNDPEVKAAHDATTDFVAQLKKDNVGFGPGMRKPNAVEQKELALLHSATDLAATKAAKQVSSDEKEQVTISGHIASTLSAIDYRKAMIDQSQQRNDTARTRAENPPARGGGAGGAGGGTAVERNSEYATKAFGDESGDSKVVDVNNALQGGQKAFGTSAIGSAKYAAAKNYAIDKLHLDPNAFSNASSAATAVKAALKQQTQQQDAGLAASSVAMENAKLVEDNFKKLGNTNFKSTNQVENWFKDASGDPALAATKQSLLSFLTEYTRATNAPMSSAALHEGAMTRAMHVLSEAQTPGGFKATLDVMKQEMTNANEGRRKAVEQIATTLPTASNTQRKGGGTGGGGGEAGGGPDPMESARKAYNAKYNVDYDMDQFKAQLQ